MDGCFQPLNSQQIESIEFDSDIPANLDIFKKESLDGKSATRVGEVKKEVELSRRVQTINSPMKSNPHLFHGYFPVKGVEGLTNAFLFILISPLHDGDITKIMGELPYLQRLKMLHDLFFTLLLYSKENIIMYDVAPRNILYSTVGGTYSFVLTDFGLSSLVAVNEEEEGEGEEGEEVEEFSMKKLIPKLFSNLKEFEPMLKDEGMEVLSSLLEKIKLYEKRCCKEVAAMKKSEIVDYVRGFYRSCLESLNCAIQHLLETNNPELMSLYKGDVLRKTGVDLISRIVTLEKDMKLVKEAAKYSPTKRREMCLRIGTLEQKNEKLEDEVSQLKMENQKKDETIQELRLKNNKLEEKVSFIEKSFKKKIKKLKEENRKVKFIAGKKIESLETETQRMGKENQKMGKKIESLEKENQRVGKENQMLKKVGKENSQKIRNQSLEIYRLKSHLEAHDEAMRSMVNSIKRLELEVSNLRDENRKLKEKPEENEEKPENGKKNDTEDKGKERCGFCGKVL